jgi:hypothetical protein
MENQKFKLMKKNIILLVLFLVVLGIGCSLNESGQDRYSDGGSGVGQGGSMAGFTIIGDHLYTISGSDHLKVVDISEPEQPKFRKSFSPGFGIETIFPRGKNLFLGSQNGMYIYDATNPENPEKLSFYQHVFSCDPVVADANYAYVTMNSVWGNCGQNTNLLEIVDISDLRNPKRVLSKAMDSPRGLSIQNDTLVVCDNGLKVFKVSDDRKAVTLVQEFDINATDLISLGNNWLVVGDDGFFQYQIKNNEIKLLSSILKD